MKYIEIIEKIQNIFSSSRIQAFCQETWESLPTCYFGVDLEDPPESSKYPVLAFLGAERERGDGAGEVKVSFVLFVGVYDAEKTEEDNNIKYLGLEREHQLRELVELEVFENFRGSSSLSVQTIIDNVFPFFSSEIRFSVWFTR